jgi:Transposase DDE domain
MNPKKHLSFGSLRNALSSLFHQLSDMRQQGKTDYSIHDAMMSGFACMYFQDPSLLQFQERLREAENRDNLQTLFGVKDIPSETQLRDIVDEIESEQLRPIFKDYFSRLQRGKHLLQYQLFEGLYICSLDGTQYFHSQSIHCPGCLKTTHKNGEISYSHKVLQAAIMHPDMRQIIPLMPEEIRNTDGNTKQDCEINAAKRLVPKIKKDHPQLDLIIVGDALFSKQPFISEVLADGNHYIFAVKPDSHKYLMEWIEAYDKEDINELRITDEKGRIHVYEWVNNVPLNGRADSINVNFFRYQIISKDKKGNEKVTYKNSWITDLEIRSDNAATLVRAARCRWKIENECFNTLKNQGYYIEHNYGHGEKNLCFNFLLLTLLAFFFHQIFELTDHLYQACRKKFGSKRNMWENLRVRIRIFVFETWERLLDFALNQRKYNISLRPP